MGRRTGAKGCVIVQPKAGSAKGVPAAVSVRTGWAPAAAVRSHTSCSRATTAEPRSCDGDCSTRPERSLCGPVQEKFADTMSKARFPYISTL